MNADVQSFTALARSEDAHLGRADRSFGCNGFRLGVVISQHNPLVIRGLLHINFVAKRECCWHSFPCVLASTLRLALLYALLS